jgi:glucose/mannose transport system substrate-binding protein
VHAFEVFRRLNNYVDAGNSNRKWNDTALLVEKDQAAMFIMGDWAKGDFLAAGQAVGREFDCAPAPGTAGYTIISVDAMAFPKASRPDADAARRKLAETLMDPAAQAGFDVAKGTQPARLDAPMPPPDSCSKLTTEVAAADPAHLLPNNGLAFPPDTDGQLSDLVSQFWGTPGMTAQQAATQFGSIIADMGR